MIDLNKLFKKKTKFEINKIALSLSAKKPILIMLVACLPLNSCTKKEQLAKYDKNGNPIIYNLEVYAKIWMKNRNLKATIIDTFCINQKARAISDIKKGKLIQFCVKEFAFKKLSQKLSKYGIEARMIHVTDLRLGGFESYCYEREMDYEVIRRFGKNFIDSLYEATKKEYLLENPNVKYIEDGEDLRKKYGIAIPKNK